MRDAFTVDREIIVKPVDADRAQASDSLDILFVLASRSRTIAVVTAIFLLGGLATALSLKPNFTATAIILPPQQQQSTLSTMLGQLGSLGSLAGASSLGLKSPSDMYIGFLKSRTIGDAIIQEFGLKDVYRKKNMHDVRKALASHTEIEAGKDTLIHIVVTDHDPNRASEIANAYVDQLYKLNSNVAITEAAQRRVFFDQQLKEEKTALAAAEDDLRNTQQRTGIIQLGGQAEVVIRSVAQTRAEIASREVELQSLRTYATDQNPQVSRLQEEIAALRTQLAKLENDQQSQLAPGDISVPAGRVPEEGLEYARKLREVKYHDALYALLARQLEAARIDEAKSAPIIQVIDRAVPADKRSGPPRLLLTIGLALAGFLLACAWVLVFSVFRHRAKDPRAAAKVERIRDALARSMRSA